MKKLPYFCHVLFFLITLLTGCITLFPTPGEKLMIHAGSIGSQVGSKYGLAASGTGASWPGAFKFVSIDYTSDLEMEIDEARELIVQVVEDLLMQFKVKAAPDCQLEFNLENLCVMIFFKDRYGNRVKSETKLALVAFTGDDVIYDIYPLTKGDFETVLREPYLEAYQKVMGKERRLVMSISPLYLMEIAEEFTGRAIVRESG